MSLADSEFVFIFRTEEDAKVWERHFKPDLKVSELLRLAELPPGEYLYIRKEKSHD